MTLAQQVLMFISQEDTYYSEYIVMREGLEALGYAVDLRTATSSAAGCYMVPEELGISTSANGMSGSSYAAFQTQFLNLFGSTWNESLNDVPSSISVNGSILDVSSMDNYVALVIPGGTGAQAYLIDGTYEGQGTLTAQQVQSVAEKLNELAIEALQQDKPVLAQCHGAGLPAHWRVPDTSGAGVESLGYSLLKGGFATGFPEEATPTTLSSLDITHKTNDRVTISGVHESLGTNGAGQARIITTRDWYPQTVAYATKTLINVIETFPTVEERDQNLSVLVLHGGAVNPDNCGAGNRENDVPCNYGTEGNLPADYTDVVALLQTNSSNDSFTFSVTELNLAGSLPFVITNTSQIETYLEGFDAIIFYKHWSTYLSDELQNELVNYVDNGGGVLALHHGLYNDIDNTQSKNILAQQLFGAQSSQSGWSANRTTYNLVATNHGHFITTFGLNNISAISTPPIWSTQGPNSVSNLSLSYYPAINLFDEIYNNMAFEDGVSFGNGVNDIQPLFSNDLSPAPQSHVAGFARRFNPSFDATEGRTVYVQPGETIANYSVSHPYGQVIRNAMAWIAKKDVTSPPTPLSISKIEKESIYPNPTTGIVYLPPTTNGMRFTILNQQGQIVWSEIIKNSIIEFSNLPNGLYFIQLSDGRMYRCVKN